MKFPFKKRTVIDYKKLLFSIWLTLFIGFAGSYFTMSSIDSWYSTLNKPFFNPPNWIFWPVWTTLYIMIGISFYIVWGKNFWKKKYRTFTKNIYFIQLFLNFTWSIAFFYIQSPILWLINIIILWVIILINIKYFYKVNKIAWYLLIPYILWVSFASILNLSLYILN